MKAMSDEDVRKMFPTHSCIVRLGDDDLSFNMIFFSFGKIHGNSLYDLMCTCEYVSEILTQ